MSDTPRKHPSDAENMFMNVDLQEAKIKQLERELAAALARIKRLEEAGDAMSKLVGKRSRHFIYWTQAKEAR